MAVFSLLKYIVAVGAKHVDYPVTASLTVALTTLLFQSFMRKMTMNTPRRTKRAVPMKQNT